MEITVSTRLILAQHAKTKKPAYYDYKVGDRVLVIQDGILRIAQGPQGKEPWTIKMVHTHETIRIQRGSKWEQINIRRVTPYTDD